jgi:5-methyltetrahydrofolate--homocysteine methyltransferase
MEAILPIAETYGAAIVVLALDDSGIPDSAAGRLEIVERVRKSAHAHGLADSDLVVDALVMTAATDGRAASETLEAVRVVSQEWGLATVLGVSNVSHGLPGRPALNSTFLAMARQSGLHSAIVNPSDPDVARSIAATEALLGIDEGAERWIALCEAEQGAAEPMSARSPEQSDSPASGKSDSADKSPQARLSSSVLRGDSEAAPDLVDRVIESGTAPGDVIGDVLTPTIQDLGDRFGRGEVFLPQLMVAAEAMKAAVSRVKTHLPDSAAHSEGKVVFATVKGDIHSIGKDICVSLLQSQGFEVHDLGVDVETEAVLSAAEGADAVCLSALMTTTLPAMRRTVAGLAELDEELPVLVGGAVVTGDWASEIGAGYSADAPGCVVEVRNSIASRRGGVQ